MSEQEGFTPQESGMMGQVVDPEVKRADYAKLEEMKAQQELDAQASQSNADELITESQAARVDNLEENEVVLIAGEVVPQWDPPVGKAQSPTRPSIGRVVVYRSRTGNYSVPAIVNCTVDSIYQPGVEAGFVPALSDPNNVHLTVLSPGKPGMRANKEEILRAEPFVVVSEHPVSENVSGCYQEWDIPYDENGGPGSWSWPPRV